MKSSDRPKRSSPRSSFQSLVQNDEQYTRTVARLRKRLASVPVADLYKELESLHKSRLIRSILVNDVFADQSRKAIEADLQNTSFRSRATEIKMAVLRIALEIESGIETCKKYLRYQYSDAINASARTQADRAFLLDTLFSSLDRKQDELNGLLSVINVLVEDLDQAGWTIKRINEFVLEKQRERHEKR